MEVTKEKLNIKDGLTKEWIITNGIGGFASSTIIGANTRRYHGLLIAPLTPPARRFLMLSKLDESIEIENKKYNLYTNICKNYISDGYRYQENFRKDYIPIFKYKVEGIEITKMICMDYGKNTVGIFYKIINGNKKAKLNLAPIINYRDFHTLNKNDKFDLKQIINKNKVKIIVDENSQNPIYIKLSEGKYVEHKSNVFKNMFYTEEEKRGFDAEENHAVCGVFEVEIKPKEIKELSFVCSLEENIDEINVKDLINNEIVRLNTIFNDSLLIDTKKRGAKAKEDQEVIKNYIIATDNFIVNRPSFGYHTIIAGYPWFLDWGRDSLISFEGLLLVTKRYKEAREVLLTMVRDIKFGLVPNGYSGFDNRPLYNSADASLLLFEAVQKYIEYTNDYKFIKENLYEKMEEVLENYINGINVDNNNIYLDEDNLIVSGTPDTQNTWMDVKINNHAVTPRNGKVVEMNSLWYNSLMIMAKLSNKFSKKSHSKNCKDYAKKTKEIFEQKFYNEKKGCLFDVLGDDKIRPNQLYSLSLTYPIIDPDSNIAQDIIKVIDDELINDYGLKTLSSNDPNYVARYEGDEYKRDTSYHQGITWTWLFGLYYNALKNMRKYEKVKAKQEQINEKIEKFRKNTNETFKKELYENGCIGSIAEIYDSSKSQLPKGTFAQAWSVAEVFRIILGK